MQLTSQQHQLVAPPHHMQAQQVVPPPDGGPMLYKRARLAAIGPTHNELTKPLQIDTREVDQNTIKRVSRLLSHRHTGG